MKKAMIFAAGLGTRLRPLTNNKPKAMVEVNDQTLLEINIRKLVKFGFTEIVVNVHHFADLVIDFLSNNDFGANIYISDETDELLETGGGLLKASPFLNDSHFLVHNVDVLTNLDLSKLWDLHIEKNALATLAIRKRKSSRYLLFDEDNILHGWTNIKEGIVRQKRPTHKDVYFKAFSGVHVVNPKIFSLFQQKGKFSIIDTYLNCAKNHLIQGFEDNESTWLDVGKLESLEMAKKMKL